MPVLACRMGRKARVDARHPRGRPANQKDGKPYRDNRFIVKLLEEFH